MREKIQLCICLFAMACLSALPVRAAQGSAAPHVSGSYQILRQSETGGQTRTRLLVHLVNHAGRDLRIQRITLWDFSHPARGGTQPSSLLLRSAGSADTTLEFTIPRAEYEFWRRGARPRLVLEIAGVNGHPGSEAVRLDHVSGGKGN